MFAAAIRRKRADLLRACRNWRWHVDELLVKINGEHPYPRRVADHEGDVLEADATKRPGRKAPPGFLDCQFQNFLRSR